MRKIILSAIVYAAFASQAVAADFRVDETTHLLTPAPAYTWTGFYIGVNGGFGGDEFRYPVSVSNAATTFGYGQGRLTSSGFLGGGQVGYNFQIPGYYILGLEADFSGASITGAVGANGAIGDTPFSLSAGSTLDYFGTVRGRLGFAFRDRLIGYVTGGFAYGGLNSWANGSAAGLGSFGVSKSNFAEGWTVGGGVEYAITNNWTLKTEYLYADLGSATLFNAPIFATGVNASLRVKTSDNLVRFGINYKFGLPEALVVAKY
jgi:outer membrane immunogenic protein